MIKDDLANIILFDPLNYDINKLMILSGYATPNMASWYIKNITGSTEKSIDISLLVGMVPYDGLSVSVHEGFRELLQEPLPREISNFHCSYVFMGPPVHSNLYIWAKDDTPIVAYIGSADFTQNAFIRGRHELMVGCNADEALCYYCEIESRSVFCNHAEVEEYIILYPTHAILDMDNRPIENLMGANIQSVTLSLLAEGGETGKKSGVNWGQRNRRNKNEAYIGLPARIAQTEFFPLQKQHFTVVTDDGHQLILRVEQQNNKAITTPLSNAQLGEYLRNRIGIANGAYIRREDLERYGRTDITFYKLDEEQYYMDFSV